VGLEDDMDVPESILPGGSQSGANLSRVMAIVIDHAYAPGFSPHLQPAVNSPERFESRTNLIGRYVQADCNRNGSRRI
jgi:hypothetical protein